MSPRERATSRGSGRALPVLDGRLSRRGFVKAMGVAAAALGSDACWQPPTERILPYAEQPPEVVPGVPVTYATASVLDGYATGLLVQTREGRPIKVEGNPSHPASLGASGVFEQAMLRDLYDGGRTRAIGGRAGARPWSSLLELFRPRDADGGHGLAVLLEPTSSPLRAALLDRLQERFPSVRVAFHDALGASPALEAWRRAAGRPLLPRYDLGRARTVVAFDADFLAGMPFHLRYARDFAAGRSPDSPSRAMSRLYVAEPSPSSASSVADHLLRVRAGDVVFLLGALVRALGGSTEGLPTATRVDTDRARAWVAAAAADLRARPGEGVVIVGDTQPTAAHLLAHEANRLVGTVGRTVMLQEPALARADHLEGGLAALTGAIRAGDVDRLVVLGGDPAHTAPADVPFADAFREMERTLHLGGRVDDTAELAAWTVPALHPFEAWGDARAFDGTLTPVQPLIRPLVPGGHSPEGVLLALLGDEDTSVYRALRAHWRDQLGAGPGPDDEAWEAWWEDSLRRGVVDGTASPAVEVPIIDVAPFLAEVPVPDDRIEVVFRADARLHDGRFSSNPWLQELPDPLTKISVGERRAPVAGPRRGGSAWPRGTCCGSRSGSAPWSSRPSPWPATRTARSPWRSGTTGAPWAATSRWAWTSIRSARPPGGGPRPPRWPRPAGGWRSPSRRRSAANTIARSPCA